MSIQLEITDIPIDTDRDKIVIAGGAALYSSGMSTSMGDIDLFSLDKDRSLEVIRRQSQRLMMSANSYNFYSQYTKKYVFTGDGEKVYTHGKRVYVSFRDSPWVRPRFLSVRPRL